MSQVPKGVRDLTGRRFGRLVVTAFYGRDVQPSGQKPVRWSCRCDCGAEVSALAGPLCDGRTQSCGCLQRERASEAKTIHGMRRSAEYRIWSLMKDRCFNSEGESFKNYGGRGISVCERWANSFGDFLSDMGARPSSRHELDRINNDRDYEPGNCRWAPRSVQANNKRNNVVVEALGERLTVAQWSRRSGIKDKVIYKRLVRGWLPERAVTELPSG